MKKPAKRGTGGPAKPPPDDPEQSRRFEETARELVFSLRAAFENRDAPRDAKFQRLVVTSFVMQA